jgi:hypothetical protein
MDGESADGTHRERPEGGRWLRKRHARMLTVVERQKIGKLVIDNDILRETLKCYPLDRKTFDERPESHTPHVRSCRSPDAGGRPAVAGSEASIRAGGGCGATDLDSGTSHVTCHSSNGKGKHHASVNNAAQSSHLPRREDSRADAFHEVTS